MGSRSSNTNKEDNRRLNGHLAYFYNSNLNSGVIAGQPPAPEGINATGGQIEGTYTDSGTKYKYHIYSNTGSSTFVVSSISGDAPNYPNNNLIKSPARKRLNLPSVNHYKLIFIWV